MTIYIHWPYRIFCWVGWHEYMSALVSTSDERAQKGVPLRWGPWTCEVCGKTRGPYRWERST